MKHNVYLVTMKRSVGKACILLVLLILASNLFASRWGEFIQMQNMITSASEFYRPIGTLNTQGVDELLSTGVKMIEESPYVDFVDKREKYFAALEGIYNVDTEALLAESPFYAMQTNIHNSDFLFYGELVKVDSCVRKTNNYSVGAVEFPAYELIFKVKEVVAGYPDYAKTGDIVRVYYHITEENEESFALSDLHPGDLYFIKSYFDSFFLFDDENIEQQPRNILTMKPINEECWYIQIPEEERIDFDLPTWKAFREELEKQEINRHAVNVTATKDMSKIPLFQEESNTYFLAAGRFINRDDDMEQNAVCVIRKELAEKRGLKIGDKITLNFIKLDTEDYLYLYINGNDNSWKENESTQMEYEIVGTFGAYPSDYHFDETTYFFNEVYIPESQIPNNIRKDNISLSSADFSFVLNNANEQDKFMAEAGKQLSEAGIEVRFVGRDSTDFWNSASMMKQAAILNAILFTIIFILILLAAIYYYIRIQSKNIAIQRALGIEEKVVLKQFMKPMLFLIGLASISGCLLAGSSMLFIVFVLIIQFIGIISLYIVAKEYLEKGALRLLEN